MKRTALWVLAAVAIPLVGMQTGCKGNLKSNSNCQRQCGSNECGPDGCGGICGTCGPGLSCAQGRCISTFCGNGRVDNGESCDRSIATGQNGACAAGCDDDGNACTAQDFFGTAANCDAECKTFLISQCEDGDGCCPEGCSETADDDCGTPADCGNGTLDDGEACDGNCPTAGSCMDTDGNACTVPQLTGSADNCSAACAEITIEECINDDMCCPEGCSVANDNDCDFVCGDGVRSGAETCDNMIAQGMPDACPMDVAVDCPDTDTDQDDCTVAEILGMASDCSASCNLRTITAAANGDGCCPQGVLPADDDDCMAVCGNDILEAGELCEANIPAGMAGYCPVDAAVDCDDMDACTTDAIVGAAATCDAECENTDIMQCINDDGCCYFACTVAADNDCLPLCDDYCTMATTTCVGANELFADDNMSGDAMDECQTACQAFMFQAGTSADMVEDTLNCRIYHLGLAAANMGADADIHCPHAAEVSNVCNM